MMERVAWEGLGVSVKLSTSSSYSGFLTWMKGILV